MVHELIHYIIRQFIVRLVLANIPPAWHTPKAEVDLRKGGSFFLRMEKKDGSEGFDHAGHYNAVVVNELIEYTVNDGRKSIIRFASNDNTTRVTETFEPETNTPLEVQKEFVQAVLDNFKRYAERVRK